MQTIKAKILEVPHTFKTSITILTKLLPVISFVPPLLILYVLHPLSFEQTYHGRTLLLFFLWLVLLEIVLSWEKFQRNNAVKLISIRTVLFAIGLLLPSIYVIAAQYCGLNTIIENSVKQILFPGLGKEWIDHYASLIPLAVEYLVFAVLFGSIILLEYGVKSLMDFSLSTLFLGTIGVLFAIDLLYPLGRFMPLQVLVPATATVVAMVLNLMGYGTTYEIINHPVYGFMPYLDIKNHPWAGFGLAWPCSGYESLLIYTVTILLFLKKTDIPWKHKIIYFAIGAVVTFFINILRVVTLYLIAIEKGPSFNTSDYDWQRFHNYYGMLYSITWIISYPLTIIGSRVLWRKIINWKTYTKSGSNLSIQTRLTE